VESDTVPQKCVRAENGIELWHVPHPAGLAEGYLVKDKKRTPEDWQFKTRAEADAKFEERRKHAETHPPLRR
jgi:hypothetical protein